MGLSIAEVATSVASRRKGCYSLRQNLDVTIDNTSFNSLYQVTADSVEHVGCDDFLHGFVGFGFGEVFFGVGDGDDFAAACKDFSMGDCSFVS
jgi:hypothetical protein